jgi:adenylate cyclase
MLANDSMWRALMVTDLVQWTRILERVGDAQGLELMMLHNQLFRACLQRYRGSEYAHTGDGFIAAFSDPWRALRCAAAMQQALNQLVSSPETALRARIGVHAGQTTVHEGRLFGGCVNQAVRVSQQAGASQILASHIFVESMRCPAVSAFFEPKGTCSLKGVASPLALYEVPWTRAAERGVAWPVSRSAA